MAEFIKFKEALQNHFEEMQKEATHLFEVALDKDELWNLYLDSFPAGTNEIYRERREYDCSCCRQFIKNIGAAVFIKNGEVHTVWELTDMGDTFQPVCDALDRFVKSHKVTDVYFSPFKKIGTDFNYEEVDGKIHRWDHFFLELPDKFVIKDPIKLNRKKAELRDTKNVFVRSLFEFDIEAVDTVLELIQSNTLYKGEEWKSALTEFRKYKEEFDSLSYLDDAMVNRYLYAWEKSVNLSPAIGRIKNHSIGVLIMDISNGVELEEAVRKYEKIVAPSNYKRPKAIYTKKMLEDAQKTITELGYLDSLPRRFATLDDITVNNVLFSNKDATKRMTGGDIDIFKEMEKDVVVNPRKYSNVQEIPVQNFINDILPTAREIEVLVENKHEKNFVSMIAPVNKDAKNMFKWNNPLSWAYTGNITDSDMKQNVKAAGGNVNGVLRFSIQWNEDGKDNFDLDAHCVEPDSNEIWFRNCKAPSMSRMTGQLDVDIISPNGRVAVENITWTDKSRMKPGVYTFGVHQYSGSVRKGFRAEIEFDGEIFEFNYPKSMRTGEMVVVANVKLDADGTFSIVEDPESLGGNSRISSKDIWGIKTSQFIPVSVVSYSPNYFDEQEGIGHRHLFFFLKGCVNPESPHGFYNEFLKNELSEHKRVFEALGAKCHVAESDDQLSGVGFSMTKRADLIVKVRTIESHSICKNIMRIKF